jgi:plasmid maintenance system antidote protein VapI
MTLRALAESAGYSIAFVHDVERGRRAVNASVAVRLGRALGCLGAMRTAWRADRHEEWTAAEEQPK